MKIIGFSPRETQKEIFSSPNRFLTVDAGRRWGKSLVGLNWALEGACKEGGPIWWIAPIYAQSKMAYRRLLSAAKKGGADKAIKSKSDTELRIEFVNGVSLEFKSADNYENLRGEGLKRVVVDEAARVKREVFEEIIRPAISDTAGRVLFLSTPKGKNWFYDLWTRGKDPLQQAFKSWKFPTSDNPKVPADDIEQARQSLPMDVFSQEYLAEFLENQAGVFRNVRECANSKPEDPKEGKRYYAGLDIARLTDFTVLSILDNKSNQVFFDRFNILDWAVQKQRIIMICQKYKAQALIDSTGIGDPIYDDLLRAGLNIEGYKFTLDSKKKLIEFLMLSFEKKIINILDDPVQTNELEIFEYQIGQSGLVHYSAPEGYHDDCVIAMALANWKLHHKLEIRVA
jgi:hypothetical protein